MCSLCGRCVFVENKLATRLQGMQISPSAAEVRVKWLFLNESSLLCSVLVVLASAAAICPSTDCCGISSQMFHESNSYFEYRVLAVSRCVCN